MRNLKAIQLLLLVGICSLAVSTAYGDFNFPFGPPLGAKWPGDSSSPNSPDSPGPQPNKPPKDPSKQCGSIIGCETQTLGEAIAVTGTSLNLHYQSDRVSGSRDANTLKIRLSGATLPPDLQRIHLEIAVAGQAVKKNFAPQSDLFDTFTWDGKDAYGRPVQGQQPVKIRIGYQYNPIYYTTLNDFQASFNRFGSPPISQARSIGGGSGGGAVLFSFYDARKTTPPIILWQDYEASLGSLYNHGLGGWSLSIHHSYDVSGRTLYLGNGGQRSAKTVGGLIITTVAGTGNFDGVAGDGSLATKATINSPQGIAVGPDGSLFIADSNERIRRVGPDGIITTVAGTGGFGFAGDGGPATKAWFAGPMGVAVAPDGSLYIADFGNQRIRRVAPDGIITTVAGTGGAGFSGDGGPATQAMLNSPQGVAIGRDGNLYIADSANQRIRRVAPDGIITTVAGTGVIGFSGDTENATRAMLAFPRAVTVGSDGNLYIADQSNTRIRRVGPDGIITTVAGTGQGFAGDGGPAALAKLNLPQGVAVGGDGKLYIADTNNNRIRRVGSDNYITTVVGTGNFGFTGDSGLATQARLGLPQGIAVGPDASLYIADTQNHRIRKVQAPLPGSSINDIFIAAEDGSELYVFNGTGQHLRTLDALTGALRFQFTYDSAGRLATIADGDGNVTTIGRDSSGNPAAIVATGGQRTTLAINGDGYLSRVTNPAGEAVQLAYNSGDAEGLLATLTDPRGNMHHYLYDALGRLVRDENPDGSVKTLARTDITDDHYSVAVTTALGRVTTYEVDELPTGDTRRVRIDASGARTESLIRTDGSRRTTFPDGTTLEIVESADPRFGMQVPLLNKLTITSPGGLTGIITASRSMSLSDPSNLLSLKTQTDTITVNGKSTVSLYDGVTRKITHTTAEGRKIATTWDAKGKLAALQTDVTLGIDSLQFSYDSLGRLNRLGQGDQFWAFGYDGKNRLSALDDAAGRTIGYDYDGADRRSKFTQPNGEVFGFSYDANGNLAQLAVPSQDKHLFDHTAADLVSAYTPPWSDPFLSSYDKDQRLTSHTMPSQRANTYDYDGNGRPVGVSYPEATVALAYKAGDSTRRIDSISRTATMDGTTQTMAYGYDGSLKTGMSWTGTTVGQFSYSYDNNFLLKSSTLTSGTDKVSVALTRDGDGLPTAIGPFTLTRNGPRGNPTQIGDGTLNITLAYDTLGRITGRTHKVAGFAAYDLQFMFDTVGRITRKTETVSGTAHVYNYSYDPNSQVTEVRLDGNVFERYEYDANGNRSTRQIGSAPAETASFDNQGRITQQGAVSYSFDDDGFLTQRGNDLFQYSTVGELLQADVGGLTIRYGYDGFRRRVSLSKPSGGTVQYFYGNPDNDLQITHMRDSQGILTTYYYDDGGRLFALQRGATRYYVVTDQLGSPKLVVDPTGTVVKSLSYGSFGNVILDTNPAFELPIGFAGGLVDNMTGFVRFGFRDYDPRTGRWLVRDPIRFASGDVNLYAYLMNNPINGVDLSGLGTSLGGSAYDGIGGGFKITFDESGMSFCGELGFGLGTSFGFDRNASLDNKLGIVAELGASYGTVGGAKITGEVYAGIDCGEMVEQVDGQLCVLGICGGGTAKAKQNGIDRSTSLDPKNPNADIDTKAVGERLLSGKQGFGTSGKLATQFCKSLLY